MKIFLLLLGAILICGCVAQPSGLKPERGILLRGERGFDKRLDFYGVTTDQLQTMALQFVSKENPAKKRAIVGPVVAIVDDEVLLSYPSKNYEFGMHGIFIDLRSKEITRENRTNADGRIYRLKVAVPPLVMSERGE